MSALAHGLRLLVTAALATSASAWSAEVHYEAVDLADVAAGQDLWEVRYTLDGDFGAFEGLSLLYAPGAFSQLALSRAPDPGSWAAALAQPDPGLGADGLLTLTAHHTLTAHAEQFSVSFVRLGTGLPGAQSFELFDANFTITGGGRTLPVNFPPIPEAGSGALMLLGLAALAARRLRRHHTAHSA